MACWKPERFLQESQKNRRLKKPNKRLFVLPLGCDIFPSNLFTPPFTALPVCPTVLFCTFRRGSLSPPPRMERQVLASSAGPAAPAQQRLAQLHRVGPHRKIPPAFFLLCVCENGCVHTGKALQLFSPLHTETTRHCRLYESSRTDRT